jgi:catechol 2,3-dioxygenase-like lactoylglutathione lyase family enzyme
VTEKITRPRLITTTPLFVVADLRRSLAFYCDRLGFGDAGVWGEPPCFAMCHRDGFELMLSLAENPAHIRPNGPNGLWDLYVRVPSLEAEAAALAAAGVPLVRQPEKTVYEMIEMEILDPDGYRICFGQNSA